MLYIQCIAAYIRCMLFTSEERRFATEIRNLVYGNPFLEERIVAEQRALGGEYVASQPYWSLQFDLDRKSNIDLLDARASALVEKVRGQISPRDRELYE